MRGAQREKGHANESPAHFTKEELNRIYANVDWANSDPSTIRCDIPVSWVATLRMGGTSIKGGFRCGYYGP